ncbi:MAG: hypothetical protein WC400_02875 [Patescibacteria group bacterium]|jgi:low affinity Fe/Cu permease
MKKVATNVLLQALFSLDYSLIGIGIAALLAAVIYGPIVGWSGWQIAGGITIAVVCMTLGVIVVRAKQNNPC